MTDVEILAGILRKFIDMNNHGDYVGYIFWDDDHITIDAGVPLTADEVDVLARIEDELYRPLDRLS